MCSMTFTPRTAIVTGSESGIGRATAVALAKAGMDVGVTYLRDPDAAARTADEVRSHGRKAVVSQIDVADLDNCGDVIDGLAERLGGLDVFVNNAGYGRSAMLVDATPADWREVMAVNVDGPFICIQRAARRMIAAGTGGRIIAVTSVHAHQPRVGMSSYVAAKHGLSGLIKTAALELSEYGITANSVAPGEIATPGTGLADRDPLQIHRPGVPLGRPGDAREVAAVITFLASPAASYVTGAAWSVDGGMLQMGPQAGSHMEGEAWRRPGQVR
jgi:NAD(P)-dependent dehydrogenase (short-subunit alcohol dehydrogenase family)